ncbi:hypothetical protein KC343_g1552 [Hortaea werneckii]|nr:hypothetical protein KC352_g6139 [Hortaea werneckii]KAI7572046.1 hypothetical protein KC317_g1110 [Hortaea werneckii]KAI7622226.1 hypothetical protein KC346_g3299 [Hortaea werneckii]KAI7635900.1 hypothetical protein KC343_g1552 [Hortaea werneckii]KAI7676910.1 hypothetical protein KC319_g4219 [Hortaea werneckii]
MAPTRATAVGSPSRRLKVEQQRSSRGATNSDPSSKLRDSHLQGGETIDLVRYAETESITVSHSIVGIPSAKPIRHINTPKPEVFSTRVPQQSSKVTKPKVDSKYSSPQRRGIHFSQDPETQKQLSELYTGIMASPESGETSVPAHRETAADEPSEKPAARKRGREDDEWAQGGTTPTKKILTDHRTASTVPKAPEAASESTSKVAVAEKRDRGREQYLQAEVDQLRREKEAAEERVRKAEEKEDWLCVRLEESKRRNREAGEAKMEHERRGMELTNVKVRCDALSEAVDKLRAEKVKLQEERDKLRDEKEKLETTNHQQTNELGSAQKEISELKSKLGNADEMISNMRKHFETFKTGSSRAMKKIKSKARLISKRMCGMREELKTETKSRDQTTGIALDYRDSCSRALTDRAQIRQQLDLRNSFDEEMGEGEPESAATTTRVETGTFGRPSFLPQADSTMSDAAGAANTTPISTGTFGRPSFLPQADSTMSDAGVAAPASTQNSTGTFGPPSYPSQVDTPMSDAATKPTGHNNKNNININNNNNNNKKNSSFFSDIKRKLKRTNWSRSSVFRRKKPAKQQQNRASRLPKLDTPMPDASKQTTTNSSTHLSGFTAPPPTGPRRGGYFSGHGHGTGQQQTQAKTQSAQLDVAMTDDGKANVDYTNGGSFGSASQCAERTAICWFGPRRSNQSNKPLGSMPPSGPQVSEFGRRSGNEEGNRSPRAAELDRSMPDATESGSHGNGSQSRSGVSGQKPQLSVGTRRIETQRRADDETKKLNRSLEEIAAMPTSSSAERRLKRYKI